jgi:quaternary ammonium compound-resistance protein SugE
MAWLLVVVAGLFETGFAVMLKLSHGLTNLWPTAGFAACALISFAMLTVALGHLEVGPAYAVWTGIGAAGTAIVGMALLGETVSALKLLPIGLVLGGVVGLKSIRRDAVSDTQQRSAGTDQPALNAKLNGRPGTLRAKIVRRSALAAHLQHTGWFT